MNSKIIGKPVPIIDAAEKVSGDTSYIDDFRLKNLLIGSAMRSPHPHARILKIDTSDAEKLSGVVAVLSKNNTTNKKFGINLKDETAFCSDKSRYLSLIHI